MQLASTLQGVVTQNLVPTADGLGRTAALEILMPDDAVRNLIRQAKVEQIYSVMQTSTSRGMQTMEQSLADLVLRHVITPEIALRALVATRPAPGPARALRHDELPAPAAGNGSTAGNRPQHRAASARLGGVENVDLNKEIKLSDLVRRPKKKTKAGVVEAEHARSASGAGKQEIVGLKIGASQIAASRVVNNGGRAKLVQLARVPLEPGIVVGGEVRDVAALAAALDRFFTDNKLPRRGVRLGIGTNRIGVRTVDIDGIDDERQLENAVRFRAHEALSIPLDQAVLDYHVVSETVDESGRRLPARPARRRVPGADRPLRRGVPGGEASSSRASTSRRSRCCAPSRRARATADAPTAASSSSRSVTTARRSRSRTARSATSRACSTGAARSSTPRSRASSG